MEVEEGDMQGKGIENIFNKTIENCPNLEKEMIVQVQEAFSTPNRQGHKKLSYVIL
jgi:hypothetical protein